MCLDADEFDTVEQLGRGRPATARDRAEHLTGVGADRAGHDAVEQTPLHMTGQQWFILVVGLSLIGLAAYWMF